MHECKTFTHKYIYIYIYIYIYTSGNPAFGRIRLKVVFKIGDSPTSSQCQEQLCSVGIPFLGRHQTTGYCHNFDNDGVTWKLSSSLFYPTSVHIYIYYLVYSTQAYNSIYLRLCMYIYIYISK